MARPVTPVEERFWPKVDRSGGDDACWPWLAHRAWNGYGEFRMPLKTGKLVKAHRFSYELIVGPVSDGLDLDHTCRNRACCNPKHLEPVTRKTNARRGLCGAHNSKLTHQDHLEIKALRGVVSGTELARRFGVNKTTISRIQLHVSSELSAMQDRFQRLDQHPGK